MSDASPPILPRDAGRAAIAALRDAALALCPGPVRCDEPCDACWRAAEVAETAKAITARLSTITLGEKLWTLLMPCGGLCSLCGGSGHLLCHQDGKREFWDCPACGGVGARALFSRPVIRTHAR